MNKETLQNILVFLARGEIKSTESVAHVQCIQAVQKEISNILKEEKPKQAEENKKKK